MTVSRALYRSSDLINDPSFFRFLRHPRLLLLLLTSSPPLSLSFSLFSFFSFSSYYGTEVSLLVAAMFRYLYQLSIPFQSPIPIIKNRIAFSRQNSDVSISSIFVATRIEKKKQRKEIQIYTIKCMENNAFELLRAIRKKKRKRKRVESSRSLSRSSGKKFYSINH